MLQHRDRKLKPTITNKNFHCSYVFFLILYRIKSVNDEKVDNTIQNSHFRAQALKEVFASENAVLVNFHVWDEGSTKNEDSEVTHTDLFLFLSIKP